MDDGFASTLRAYSRQGWSARDMVWPESGKDQVREVGGIRRVGDSLSLVIPLETNSVQPASTPDHVIENSQFEVARPRPGWVSDHELHIQVYQIKSAALRHMYIVSKDMGYVEVKLKRWIWFELHRLEPAERPEQFVQRIPNFRNLVLPEEFKMPESWDYADDQLSLWLG